MKLAVTGLGGIHRAVVRRAGRPLRRGWRVLGHRGRTRRPGRVLIIVQNLPVPRDRRVWRQCQALVADGHEVSVICPRGPGQPAREKLDGVRLYRYPAPKTGSTSRDYLREYTWSLLATMARILQVGVGGGFDVVQACNPPDIFVTVAAPFRLAGKRLVFDQHDLCPELYAARFGRSSGAAYRGMLLLERLSYLLSDHVIVTNESYRRVAMSRGRRRPESVTVVRNGPELARMRRRAPRTELKQGRTHLCCYLGVMGPQDGVDLALQALHHLVHQLGRTDCHFAFIGDGDTNQFLRRLARELRVDEWVTFTGFLDGEIVFDYLSTAEVGLCPDPLSPFNDVSTMNKTLEYMAFELPVVAFDLLETRRSAGAAALYAPPNDVRAYAELLHRLLDDPALRAEMGRIGRRRIVTSLAWDHQRPGYLELYRRLLSAPGARPPRPAAASRQPQRSP
jgi:glycosyltransferase involved in cell wall biosynthesis